MEDLYGLILAGGYSERMGQDKANIRYHTQPQIDHLLEVMQSVLSHTFLSLRKDQKHQSKLVIHDKFEAKGPLNGLLSAHDTYPTKAWLAMAVDMPFVTASTMHKLMQSRDQQALATTLVSRTNGFPEPLAAIWEVKGLELLMKSYIKGEEKFPSRFLMDHAKNVVTVDAGDELINVNDEVDLAKALQKLRREK